MSGENETGPDEQVDSEQADSEQADSTPEGSAAGADEESRSTGAAAEIRGWFHGRLPDGWFTVPAEVVVDREEVTVIGTLTAPENENETETDSNAAAEGRIKRFREETRGRRIEIAKEAERKFERKVSWGARCGARGEMFTTLSVPVMTRLRQAERRVLDTLVDSGVARSRSDALAWCVRLTGEHTDAWLTELRAALRRVEEVRSQGPFA
jgi:hypothetical protein